MKPLWTRAGWTLAVLMAVLPLGATADQAPKGEEILTACLPRNAGVLAGRRMTGGSGFDYTLMKALAAHLGRPFQPVWYENELEEESDPLRETYAMLSHGLCDVVPGHPRYARAVGTPSFKRASLPRWLGMPEDLDPLTGHFKDRLAGFVDVHPIDVTDGYMRAEMGLVYRKGTPEPQNLGDLGGRALSFQQGTLSGAIVMAQATPAVRAAAHHHNPGAGFLWEVESTGVEVAFVDVAAFDSHLKANPFSDLKLAPWRHPLGMDIGIAVPANQPDLRDQLNAALSDLMRDGTVKALAVEAGLSYAPPQSQSLTPSFTLQTLQAIR